MLPRENMTIKSPFLVKQEFLSLKTTMYLVEEYESNDIVNLNDYEISNIVKSLDPDIGRYFDTNIVRSTINYETHTTDTDPVHACESSVFKNKLWYRNKDIDFVSVIFLKDFFTNHGETIDFDMEVMGGKLEFPNFKLHFTPEAGTCITYPAVPNFINTISKVKLGSSNVLRILHRSDSMFVYKPEQFKGNINNWFSHLT